MTKRGVAAIPQVPHTHYYSGEYDHTGRWSSYWIQICEALAFRKDTMMEIGMGNGIVATYLTRIASCRVITVDFDPSLGPDIVADIAHLPVADQSIDCVMACEVLEHLPFEKSTGALRELRRISKAAIISVPNSSPYCQAKFQIGTSRKLALHLDLPWLRSRDEVLIPNEHFWEIGLKGYSVQRFESTLRETGWNIKRSYRNEQNPFHHFFVLDANC